MQQEILYIIIGLALGFGLFLIFSYFQNRKSKDAETEQSEKMLAEMELRLKALLPEVMKDTNEMVVKMASEQLGAQTKEVKTDLENKRGEIDRLVKIIRQDLKNTHDKLQVTEKEQAGSFEKLKSALDEYKELTQQLAVSTEGLKKVLSNNQMRGQFGEQIAEDLLRMTGFVKGTDYEFNRKQEGSQTRPDFAVFLPDGMRINVDVKFPYAQLQKMTEAESKSQKMEHAKLFERDVKEKIKQVSTRDYINPDDKTVDFVILFIPNEMIFSYVYDKMPEVWEEAMRNKVVLAGPFSFTAILRMVRQAYDNFKYQSNIHEIVGHVKAFEKEFTKFIEEFDKVGKRLEAAQKQFDSVASTRRNQLTRRMEKVRLDAPNDGQDVLRLVE